MSRRDKRKKHQHPHGEDTGNYNSGLLGSMRGGLKRAAGQGAPGRKGRAQRALDIILWIAVIAALVYFISRRM